MRPLERHWMVLIAAVLLGCVPEERRRGPAAETEARAPRPVEWDIPIERNEAVERWIEYYSGRGRRSFEITLARAGRYERIMRQLLAREGVPQDLVYLSAIESGFRPTAYSRARALGLWQFVPGTARVYGLEMSEWVDERLDPIAASRAAGDYLADLHRQYGDWYLAVAAYNLGPGNLNRAIRRAGSRDFWTLVESGVLPRETRAYVPKLIAAALIAKQPERYGVWAQPEPIATFDYYNVPDATSLDVVAEAAGVPFDEIRDLNLHLLRGVTPPGRTYAVRLPAGRARIFAQNYERIPPSERVGSVLHVVRRGETLTRIARVYGTNVSAILEANPEIEPNRLRAGQRLRVPEVSGVPGAGD